MAMLALGAIGACAARGNIARPPARSPRTPPGVIGAGTLSPLPREWSLASADRVCDLRDRIVLVDLQKRLVTVISRPTSFFVTAPISTTEGLGDRCSDAEGHETAHAGCSVTYERYWSQVLGASHLEFGTNAGNALEADDGSTAESCGEESTYSVIATCSTANQFVYVQQPVAAPISLHAVFWEKRTDQAIEIRSDVDPAASNGDRWTYRFATHVLAFDRRLAAATLDGVPCLAFRLGPASFRS